MTDFEAFLEALLRGNLKEAESYLFAEREAFCFAEAIDQWVPSRPFMIDRLKMDWVMDLKKERIDAKSTLKIFSKISDLKKIHLHAVDQQFKGIVDDKGNKLKYVHTPEEQSLIIYLHSPLNEGDEVTILFDYSVVKPRAAGYFIVPNENFPDLEYQFWTNFQEDYARYLIPIFDHPSVKFPCELILTVPEGYYAISNGELKERKKNSDGTETFHWVQELPTPAYLITAAVGKFVVYKEDVEGLEVLYYAEKKWDKDTVYRSLGKTPKMIKFFEEKLAVKYPWVKYGQVTVSNFVLGGMENISVTTLTDTIFHDAKAHKDYSSDGLIAHELAHQWGGDLFTCKSWSHGWLNEGWGTQMQNEWKKHDLGEDEYLYDQLGKQEAYFNEDKNRYRRPLVQIKWEYGGDVFDAHLYPGGAWRFYMLKHLVGEENWWQTLGYFLTKHSYTSVETIDLQRAFEDIVGDDFGWYFDQWLYKAGYPEVKIKCSYDEKHGQVLVKIEQTQEAADTPEVFRFPFTIQFVNEKGKKQRFTMEINERIHSFYLAVKEKPAMIELDPDYAVLLDATIEKPEEMWINQLTKGSNVIMRIKATKALGKKATPKAIKAIGEAILKEKFWGVQAEIAKVLGNLKSEMALEALLKATKLENSKARTAVARALGNFYQNDKAVKALEKMLDDKDSYFVVSAAAASIGKTKHDSAFNILSEHLPKAEPSWREIVVRGYLEGLATTEKIKAIDLILPYFEVGKPDQIRRAIPNHLAKLGKRFKKERPEIKDLLEKTLLNDKSFRVQYACIPAIGNYGDATLISALKKYEKMTADGDLKRAAKVSIRKLSKRKDKTEMDSLKKSIEELEKENRELKDRLTKIEAQLKQDKE